MAGAFSRGPFKSGETAVLFLNNVALLVLRSAKVACFVEVNKSADPRAKEFDNTLGEFPEKNILEERSLAVSGLLTKLVDESL